MITRGRAATCTEAGGGGIGRLLAHLKMSNATLLGRRGSGFKLHFPAAFSVTPPCRSRK